MNVTIEKTAKNDAAAHIVGEVDADNCADLGRALLADPPESDLRVDVSAISFIDSSGISELLRIRSAYADAGHVMTLVDPSPPVHRVLEITGLLGSFGIS